MRRKLVAAQARGARAAGRAVHCGAPLLFLYSTGSRWLYFYETFMIMSAINSVTITEPPARDGIICCSFCAAAGSISVYVRHIPNENVLLEASLKRSVTPDAAGGCGGLSRSARPESLYELFTILAMRIGESAQIFLSIPPCRFPVRRDTSSFGPARPVELCPTRYVGFRFRSI
ncbi:hypothetical protein EVAR_99991_1 [Eumeta japonica]|uniref:Uncharacterized protein n=1 Tax=Eumeta variegata TaxID=151549 RepID=A0A4C1ZKE2_EUMVA|nr:hypothetical protein EVAR_99991_1 [Eumeta japonica]